MPAYEIMITHTVKYKDDSTCKPFEAKLPLKKRINLCHEQNSVLQVI